MLQHILNVLTPATSLALLTLEEAKLALNIQLADTSKDAVLTQFIEQTSDVIAQLANRVFVYEEVEETFYDINNSEKRLFFSRWPVQHTDIQTMTKDGADILTPPVDWVLEQDTGTLYKPGSAIWSGSVDVVYSGGYKNPADVPPALKQCAIAVLRDAYYAMLRGALLTGIRMIAHKQARVMYYPHGGVVGGIATGGVPASTGVAKAIDAVLMKYIRHWV